MKNKIKKILSAVSLILVVSLIIPIFVKEDMQEVQAAKRLQGIQKIVDTLQEESLTVLEVVPDKAYASMGYYVYGYEPQVDEKLISRLLSNEVIESMPDSPIAGFENRKAVVRSYFEPLATVADENGETIVDISTDFYFEQLFADKNTSGWNVISAPVGKSFYDIRYGMYVDAKSVGLSVGDYSIDETTGAVSYTPDNGDCVWLDVKSNESSYQIVQFSKLYYKTVVTSNDWFEKKVLELGGVLDEENATLITGQVPGYKVEVITVTPDELEQRFNNTTETALELKDIDLIYLSNSSSLVLPAKSAVSYAAYGDTNDISWETTYNMFEYIVNLSLPVIVDDSIIPAVDGLEAYLESNNNIIRLAYMLKNYTEEYTVGNATNSYRYTIDKYKYIDENNVTFELPSELPSDSTRAEEDAKIGKALVASLDDYEDFEAKLKDSNNAAIKNASVYASIYINLSGNNIVHNMFSRNPESITVGDSDSIASSKVYGVQAIVDDIHTENFYYNLEEGDLTTEYQKSGNTATIKLSDATLLKYILNFNNRRIEIYKDKIRVLDIEPTKYSTLTVDTVKNWIDGVALDKIKEIEIIQTTSTEFIGKIDDLNEEYDLIYFGSCLGSYSGRLEGSTRVGTDGLPVYNDEALKGMIYTHVGDLMNATDRAGGLLADEYESDGLLNDDVIQTRYAGNDITETKVKQLMEYASSGYPIVISSAFYDGEGNISKGRVDKNSYMYEFMNTCVSDREKYPNVLEETTSLVSVLSNYINMPKLDIAMISKPDEYAISEGSDGKIESVNYLQKLGGRNVLIYSFEFSNNLENDSKTDYQVQLYVDINADGQYDDSEELDSLDVMKTTSSETVPYDKLKPNVRYTVMRELPDDYVGIIPWQIKVSRVEYNKDDLTKKLKSSVRATTEGFTAVEVPDDKVVKVLQIASMKMASGERDRYGNIKEPYYYTGLTLPYTNLLDDNPDDKINRWDDPLEIKDVQIGQNNYVYRSQVNLLPEEKNPFTNYFDDLRDHMGLDIQIDIISVNDYVARATADKEETVTEFYEDFYADYDMIILGFEDCYPDIADVKAAQAIDMFIKSGRSVLFSHDTTSYFNVDRTLYDKCNETTFAGNPWFHYGYHLNQYIRSSVGMDRYGITETDLSILKDGNDLSSATSTTTWETYVENADKLNKEIAYHSPKGDSSEGKNATTHEVHGFTDGFIYEYVETNQVRSTNPFYGGSTDNKSTHITQVNRGQITTYPYNINIECEGDEEPRTYDRNNGFYQMTLPEEEVATTHAQYYQLDMNIDKDNDDNADMVVWYCLSDNRNSYFPNDVRNNYYIYSVGNVTYTGMGHYQYSDYVPTGLEEAEVKLFINTMVASLNSGKKNPGINIISDSKNKNTSLNYVYRLSERIPRTDTEGNIIEDEIINDTSNVELYFYPSDVNIVNGRKEVLINYYYEVYDKSKADVILGSDQNETNDQNETKVTYLKLIPVTGNDCGFCTDPVTQTLMKEDVVENEVINGAVLNGKWVNKEMQAAAEEGKEFKVYISAQTKLISSKNENEYTTTGISYDYVTFKQRNLFELD